jgi:uncharacterized protein with ParB-like and HNH nuclease domain
MKIECFDKEITNVFEGFYRIPRFQRPYSWEREHIEEFWNDTISEQESDYFIGSIVLFKDKDVLGIVDGQQRLTTLTMMLAALRNSFRESGFEDLAKGVHQLIERRDISNQKLYVLRSESSYPYLPEFIQKWGVPKVQPKIGPEERLLKDGFEYITEQFEAVISSIKDDPSLSSSKKEQKLKQKLTEVRDKLLHLKVIYTLLDNEDDAYIIFETLNTRGKDLTISDLLKNLLTRLIKQPNKGVDTTRDKWNAVLETFESSSVPISVNSFLHHYWLSKYDYITEKKLYKSIKKALTKNNAEQFLDTLVVESQHYRQLLEPNFKKWNKDDLEIRDGLNAMNLFKVRQQIPMTLAAISSYAAGNLKSKHVKDIIGAIEKFHFSFTAIASQRSSGGISLMYASAAKNLNCAKTLEERLVVLTSLKQKLKERRPGLPEFKAKFMEIRYSTKFTKQRELVRYILAGVSRHSAAGVAIELDEMSIEHLGSENAKKPLLDDEQTACIGNLLFVTKAMNGNKLKNKSFTEKKAILIKSNVWLDDVIKDAVEWGPEQVEKRCALLAELAFNKIWKL